ncbi:MAG: hypothetical protein ACOCSF_05920 [Halanaeroarchaeum sp.]
MGIVEMIAYVIMGAVVIGGGVWVGTTLRRRGDPDSSRGGTGGGTGDIDEF